MLAPRTSAWNEATSSGKSSCGSNDGRNEPRTRTDGGIQDGAAPFPAPYGGGDGQRRADARAVRPAADDQGGFRRRPAFHGDAALRQPPASADRRQRAREARRGGGTRRSPPVASRRPRLAADADTRRR